MIATKRLQKELIAITKEPPPFIRVRGMRRRMRPPCGSHTASAFLPPPPHPQAKPLDTDILTWHYVIQGPPGSPYAGGTYHGILKFPSEYPLKPPSVRCARCLTEQSARSPALPTPRHRAFPLAGHDADAEWALFAGSAALLGA